MRKPQVKITIPGPMTILDTIIDKYYFDHEEASSDLAKAINKGGRRP